MGFENGNNFSRGRPPGAKNKKKVARVADVLSENNINPTTQILSIVAARKPNGDFVLAPKDRASIWLDLLSYCQPKPKEVEADESDDLSELDDVSNADLLKLIKSPGTA